MNFLARFLIFTLPLSLLSVNIGGLEFYPGFLLLPFGLANLLLMAKSPQAHILRSYSLWLGFFCLMILIQSTAKAFLAKDLLKMMFFILMFNSLSFLAIRSKIDVLKILDSAICFMVIFGVAQIVLALTGNRELATFLHLFLHPDSYGGVDQRGFGFIQTFRVGSLTLEPSYFAFTTSVHALLTNSKSTRRFCVVGILISFSLITVYAWLGILAYYLLRKCRFSSLFFYWGVLAAHLYFVATLYQDVPDLFFLTFFDRYAGLVEFSSHFGYLEILGGSTGVDESYPINLIRPYSNLGSVLFLLGILGFILYITILRSVEKQSRKPEVIAMIFLTMFNFYYLTSWPVIPAFIFLALSQAHNEKNRAITRES